MYVNYYGDEIDNISQDQARLARDFQLPYFGIREYQYACRFLGFLNKKDRDIFLLAFVSKKHQSEIAKILGRTQSMLSYDIQKIRNRILFICEMHSRMRVYLEWVEKNRDAIADDFLEILTAIFYTTSLTQAADIIGEKQIKVRYRFIKVLDWLKHEGYDAIYDMFDKISKQLNMVRRVYTPIHHRSSHK